MVHEATDVERFDALVAVHMKKGANRSAISKFLGYSGTNAERDIAAVREGRSKKLALGAACDVLQAQLPAAASPVTEAAPAAEAAAPCSMSAQAARPSAVSKTATSDLGATETTETATDADPAQEEKDATEADFDAMVAVLCGPPFYQTAGALSQKLGYSGAQGRRDLAAVRNGKCSKHSISSACKVFEVLLASGAGSVRSAPKTKKDEDTVPAALTKTPTGSPAATTAKETPTTVPLATKRPAVWGPPVAATTRVAPLPPSDDGAAVADGPVPKKAAEPTTQPSTTPVAVVPATSVAKDVWGREPTAAPNAAPVSPAVGDATASESEHKVLAASDVERFDDLVNALTLKGQSVSDIAAHLGFPVWNGPAALASVRERRSKAVSLGSAIQKLEALLQEESAQTRVRAQTTEAAATLRRSQNPFAVLLEQGVGQSLVAATKPQAAASEGHGLGHAPTPAAPVSQYEREVPTVANRCPVAALPAASRPASDVERFDALVRAVGGSAASISEHLGYSGRNGSRDLAAVRDGRSMTISLSAAIQKLELLRGGAHARAPAEAPFRNPFEPATKSPADPSAATRTFAHFVPPAGGHGFAPTPAPIPHGEREAVVNRTPMTAPPARPVSDVERFDALVRAVGGSAASISAHLGYSGRNGSRDLAAVRDGRSRTISLSAAIQKLELLRKGGSFA